MCRVAQSPDAVCFLHYVIMECGNILDNPMTILSASARKLRSRGRWRAVHCVAAVMLSLFAVQAVPGIVQETLSGGTASD